MATILIASAAAPKIAKKVKKEEGKGGTIENKEKEGKERESKVKKGNIEILQERK